jgi:hypothetical protein
MVKLVSEASNRYTHLFLVERDILALIHLRVLLLNKYEISSIYVIMFGDNRVQSG